MEIPEEILSELKCSICDEYLSVPPISIKLDGSGVCGRCQNPDENTIENVHYQQLAALLKFPCQHQKYGCTEEIPYAQVRPHEDNCSYRPYLCPNVADGSCDWMGQKLEVLPHFEQKHPDQILTNPCVLQHDIRKSSLQSYIINTFNLLFILHAKVCLNTNKTYHCVRLLGRIDKDSTLKYQVDIYNGTNVLTQTKTVGPQGCLAIQEHLSIDTSINSLLTFLNGYKDTKFKITINKLIECHSCCQTANVSPYKALRGWLCVNCAPELQYCRINPAKCNFVDITKKTQKHEKLYCNFTTHCTVCEQTIDETLLNHYKSTHSDITHPLETFWELDLKQKLNHSIVVTDVGPLIISHMNNKKSALVFVVSSDIHSSELILYNCILKIVTNGVETAYCKELDLKNDRYFDWYAIIDDADYNLYINRKQFKMQIAFFQNSIHSGGLSVGLRKNSDLKRLSKRDSQGDSRGDSQRDSQGDSQRDSQGDSKRNSVRNSVRNSERNSKRDSKQDSNGDSKKSILALFS